MLLLVFAAGLTLDDVKAQVRVTNPDRFSVPDNPLGAELTFARLIYGTSMGGGFRGRGRWTVDMPEAEHFFMEGINRLTRVNAARVDIYTGRGARNISLLDESIFDYPFLYAVEVGYWSLSDEEILVLREYLLRGGFFMTDDFHGTAEWSRFMAVMQRVFPDRPVVDIPDDDEIFHSFYELDQKVQIPGIGALYRGVTYEYDGYNPVWRGIYDDKGRLMVMINHNMDLGDAWEHADDPRYPQHMTALSYRFAVNYVIYAFTH